MGIRRYVVLGLGLIIYILIIKYMFSLLFPFLMAFLCFFILKPFINKIQNTIPLQESAIGISVLLLIYLFLAFVLGALLTFLFLLGIRFFQQLPVYYDSIFLPFISNFIHYLEDTFSFLPQDIVVIFQNWIHQNIIGIMNFASSFVKLIPSFIVSFFIFVISTFFLVLDYENMKNSFLRLTQKKTYQKFVYIKNGVLKSLFIYLKCQFILIFVSFLMLWAGFWILHIEPSSLYALAISLLDTLPFIGIGIVLIPMIILLLMQSSYMKAIYILCLYLIINMVRSFLEPHILNKETKIPSFLLLLSMVIHVKFFGIAGVFLSPIHLSFLYEYLNTVDDLV